MTYNLYDGHINRNIRAAMAMIDLTKPYIWVTRATYIKETDQVEVKFKINGCINITEASVITNGERTVIVTEDDNNVCNYLVPHGRKQNTYRVFVKTTDTVILEAMVD